MAKAWVLGVALALMSCGHAKERPDTQASKDAAFARLGDAAFNAARHGDFAAAREQWRAAHDLRPDDPYVLTNLGLVEDALGNGEEAVRLAARAAQIHSLSPALAVNYGLVLEHANMGARAVAEYRRALELDPNFSPALLALGAMALADGRFTQAQRHFGDAVNAHPEEPDGYAGLAAVEAARKNFAKAAGHMTEAARHAPNDALFFAAAGALYERAGDEPNAKANLDRALQIAPALGDALVVRAEIAWREGDYAAAEHMLSTAAAHDAPGERRAGSALRHGELAANLDRPDLAGQALRLALAQASQPAAWRGRAEAMLGEVALRTGSYSAAREHFTRAKAAVGETPAVCAGLARAEHALALSVPIRERAALLEKAELDYRRSLDLRENARLRAALGGLYRQWAELVPAPFRRGKLRQAEMQLREALDHEPALALAHVELAGVLDMLGRFAEASDSYQTALRIDPRASRTQFLFADLLRREALRTHDDTLMTQARGAYAQAARLDPRFAAAQIGWYLSVTSSTEAARGVTEETVIIPYGTSPTTGVPPALEDMLPFIQGDPGGDKKPDGVIPILEGDRNPIYSIDATAPAHPPKTLRP